MDERKLRILGAVVDEYIVTGEPVGSKAISKYINASSATVRNEMAELEKQGYLEQPHTSAGRVPTYNGYRLYVDKLMQTRALSEDERRIIDDAIPHEFYSEEDLVRSASNALAELTGCATVISGQNPKFSVISKVEVIPTGRRMYVLLMITSGGKIKNRTCRLEFDLTNEQLEYFSDYIKQNLEGIPVEHLSDEMLTRLEAAMGTYLLTLSPLIKGLFDISREMNMREVEVTGGRNMLLRQDVDQTEIIEFLDNSCELRRLMDDSFSGIHVMFSPESDSFIVGNSSLISANFSKNGKVAGHLGIIGPMRIDYRKVIPYIEYFTDRLSEMLTNNFYDSPEDRDEDE